MHKNFSKVGRITKSGQRIFGTDQEFSINTQITSQELGKKKGRVRASLSSSYLDSVQAMSFFV